MNGPFQPLDDLGLDLDDSLVCVDGICAIPTAHPTPEDHTAPADAPTAAPAPRT